MLLKTFHSNKEENVHRYAVRGKIKTESKSPGRGREREKEIAGSEKK